MELDRDIGRAALEQMVIAALIQSPKASGVILPELSERDFRYPEWQGLMIAAKKLHEDGLPIIEGTLVAFYGKDGQLFSAYAEQAAKTKTPENYHWLVRELRQRSTLDSIKAAAERLSAVEDMDEAATVISKINELTSSRRGVEIISLSDAMQRYVSGLGGDPPEFIKTGLRIFDDEVKLERGCYCILGGLPSAGKTLLTLQIAQTIGAKYRVGFFSCETSSRRMATRAISSRSGISNKKIIEQDLTKAEMAQVAKIAKSAKNLQLDIVQASGMTADDIRAITLSRKYDVIFVDYLQNVLSSNPRATSYEKATEVTQKFQLLSRTGNVLVFALSQLSRPETRKDGKLIPPSMASLRESGQIEQDADVIALLYRERVDDNSSCRIMKVVKNRDGELLDLLLAFSGSAQSMSVIGRCNIGALSKFGAPDKDEDPPSAFTSPKLSF